MKFYHFLCDLF